MILGQGDFSVDFANGQYVRIPTSSSLSGFDELTIECWYYQTSQSGDENLVGTEYFGSDRYVLDANSGNNMGGTLYDGTAGLVHPGTSYSNDQWIHVAMSYDNLAMRFFINGTLVNELSGELGPIGTLAYDLVINRHTWGSGESSRLSGQMDELRISNIARYTSNFQVSQQEYEPDVNTMGLWHFNGDLIDASGNGNAGIANGTGFSTNTPGLTPFQQETVTNHSLYFDGTDAQYVACQLPGPTGVSSRTITFWAKISVTSEMVVANWGDFTCGTQFGASLNWLSEGLSADGGCRAATYGFETSDSQWHHYAVVVDEATTIEYIRFYADGNLLTELVQTHSITESFDTGLGPLMFGRYSDLSNSYPRQFVGNLDEICIWDRALTEEEVQSKMNHSQNASDANLVGYWNFDEGEGLVTNDLSSSGNTGTINGAVWSEDGAPLIVDPAMLENSYSLSFNGVNNYIDFGSNAEYDIEGDFSWQIDLKLNDTSLDQMIIGNQSTAIWDGYYLNYYQQEIYFSVCSNNLIYQYRSQGVNLVNDQWFNLAVVKDSGVIYIYLNGEDITSNELSNLTEGEDISAYYIPNNGPLLFGVSSGYNDQFLYGYADNIALWSSALTQTQIQGNLTNQLIGSETSLISYFNLNTGTGSVAVDQTSNSNDGTIYGASWSTDVPFTGSSTTSWSIRVQSSQVSTSILNDVDNYLGVAIDATEGFDAAFDEAEPPIAPGSSLSLYFPHPEWSNPLGDDFSSDIRPEIDLTDDMQVWDFEVVSTDTGNVSLTFQYTAIPDVPVILENEGTGERVFLVHNESYSFYAEAAATYYFKVSIGDTTAPQVNAGRSFSGPRILRAGHQHDLDFQATDGYMVDQIELLFSSDSGNYFQPFATMGDTTTYTWVAPDTFANVLYSAALQVKAMDYAGNFSTMSSDYVLTIASDSLYSSVYSGWNLWGAPLTPFVDTMEVNIDDDFTGYWTTYDYVDNGYTYDGFLNKAAGYWLGTLEETEVDVLGAPSTTDEEAALDLGWNLLSNPLVLDVSLDSMMVINGNTSETLFYPDAVNAGWVNSIYEYDGNGYVAPAVIQPWRGYWFSALLENLTVTFPIHKHEEPILARDTREEGWGIQLFASTSNGAEDNLMMIGSHPEATDGFDNEFDEVRPPSAPGSRFVQLDVTHPEWAMPLGDSFVRDIRAENSDGSNEDWTVHISSSEDDVNLTWDVSQIPEEYVVGIDLDGDGIFQDLASFESISISAGTSFTLRVGADALAVNGLAIPSEYLLNQNYPNPFNPTTTVKYGLPEVSDVMITIYDIKGREVVQLVNSVQKSAGYHTAVWDGMDASYNQVSTGLYFTRIEAGDFSKTIKMLFLK